MLNQNAFNFGRIDVFTAADDGIALTIEDVHEALLVHYADVSAGFPPTDTHCSRRFRIVEVTHEGHRVDRIDLPHLARRQALTLVVENPNLAAEGSAPE